MKLYEYCREYRIGRGVTLKAINANTNIKTLHAFEHGMSTNYNHFISYLEFARECGDESNFIDGLREVVS